MTLDAVVTGQSLQRTSLFHLSPSFSASIVWIPLDDAFGKLLALCYLSYNQDISSDPYSTQLLSSS